MGGTCLDCHKPWGPFEVKGESPIRAVKKPAHYCTCTVSLKQVALDYPERFASGYDNQREWQEYYLPEGHSTLSLNGGISESEP